MVFIRWWRVLASSWLTSKQGTSNAAVFNCSVRNNGDDGLACWNNTQNVKDESGNVFAYNTIDFVWRAGGVAIYGGKNQNGIFLQ